MIERESVNKLAMIEIERIKVVKRINEMKKNAREKIERERIEIERIEIERNERERIERERVEMERNEREKIEKERIERERIEMEKADREKLRFKNSNNVLHKSPTLVIATNNFDGEEYDHLDIKKNEFLIVTDWNYKEGWVFGHRKDIEEEMGIFPKVFIKIYKDENKGNT